MNGMDDMDAAQKPPCELVQQQAAAGSRQQAAGRECGIHMELQVPRQLCGIQARAPAEGLWREAVGLKQLGPRPDRGLLGRRGREQVLVHLWEPHPWGELRHPDQPGPQPAPAVVQTADRLAGGSSSSWCARS